MNKRETAIEGQNGRRRSRVLWMALGLAACIAAVEYGLKVLLNPTIDWSVVGVSAHFGLDLLLSMPLLLLALLGARALSGRLRLDAPGWSGLLGVAGLTVLAFMLLSLPLTAFRDVAHEYFGNTYGYSLAEVRTQVVNSELTVQESTQLCSFGALRGAGDELSLGESLRWRTTVGVQDTLVQLGTLLPLMLLLLVAQRRRELPTPDFAPARALARRMTATPARATATALTAGAVIVTPLALTGVSLLPAQGLFGDAQAQIEGTLVNACDTGVDRAYNVHAIDVTVTLNRFGEHVEDAHMYALEQNLGDIRAFESDIEADRMADEDSDPARVSHGLRKDLIQPLVIRANVGECVELNFTNALGDGQPASMHILGLPHTVESAASTVGYNPDTMADAGQSITYRISVPEDPDAERAYYFHDHGAGRRRVNMGLFGALVIEPRDSEHLDPETGAPLALSTGSNWEAIIIDPNSGGLADGKSFREFVLLYHEFGDESFTDIRDKEDKPMPLIDDLAGVYRPGARAINYRSEPFRNRIALDKEVNGELAGNGKALGYASYPFGDPATPIPRSYVGEGVKTRLLHGGSEVFHVHHLHGGGDRWRRNPNSDPNNDFWKGLTKVPDPNLTSIHLDSQSIGPGTSYNLEHECGAGGCQQGVGDFLFHCHVGHHYIAGMWSFWRVFGTEQTADTNLYDRPLRVDARLFQADNPFSDDEAPSNTAPQLAVSAGDLIGLSVDDGRQIVADAEVVDPSTQIGLMDWVSNMLPPPGEPFDAVDATVWNWAATGAGETLRIWGEPENETPFSGYVSDTPGQRPEVTFNPKNGRYTWPLFRPQLARRVPFTPRHTGAPWLGEEMKEGRVDGLCARNGVHPSVDVGESVKRYYPVSSITMPIQVTEDAQDPDGMIFVLNEEEQAVRDGTRPAQPLAIRSNVGDCVEIIFTNKIPDGPLNKDFSKTNIHSHFVQFDTQASDGVITGFSYEQSVRPYENENRTLLRPAAAGTRVLRVTNTDRLRVGIWIGVGLGEGVCGVDEVGQPQPCTEVHRIAALPNANTIVLSEPLRNRHRRSEHVGVEFVRYNWYSDVDFGTVFFHTHVDFKDWDHGLFGAHIVEPRGSSYHDPLTGAEVRSGNLVDVRIDPGAGGNPVAAGVNGSFREFMLFLQNNNPVEGRFTLGGSTINLRAEPWRLRPDIDGDSAFRFSSVTHGDPMTPLVQAYVGDPVVVRGVGLVERVGGIRITGHRFNSERYSADSDTRDAQFIGISERFDLSLQGGAGGTGAFPGDYLYYSTLGRDFESGGWGLMRVYDSAQSGLRRLPDRPFPGFQGTFPELTAGTGGAPPSLDDGAGDACPPGAPLREYSVAITDAEIRYNDFTPGDDFGVPYQFPDEFGDTEPVVRSPVVMRANAGECLRIDLANERSTRSSLNVGELLFDPQRSYGAAIGLNYDSTVPPGESRTYEYFADAELGLVLGLNLGDIDSVGRGAFLGVVIEPADATYAYPGGAGQLEQGGGGVQADVTSNGQTNREFVALFNDQDRRIGQNTMPYPVDVEGHSGISYSAEPLDLRNKLFQPADVFNSSLWGDPRYVVTVPQGTPLTYRIGHAWGDQMHVPTLEGHRYPLEPGMSRSEQLFSDALAPGQTLNMSYLGGAGGDIAATGDYLFLDRRQPFMEKGLWNILRVTDDAEVVSVDRVTISDLERSSLGGQEWVSISGILGVRAAGDTARHVTVHAGEITDGQCAGKLLGSSPVRRGSGVWQLEISADDLPESICVRSAGGGVSSRRL